MKNELTKICNSIGRICPEKLRIFKTHNNKDWTEVIQYSEKYTNISDSERIYLFVHQCGPNYCTCGKKLKLLSFPRGYQKSCSTKCSANSLSVKNKTKITNMIRYGDENYNNREKFKKTNIEKYGVEFPQQNKEISQKRQDTCVEMYGGNSPACSNDVVAKIKRTRFELYGDENYNNIEKHKTTCLEKYGVSNYMQTIEASEKHLESTYKYKTYTFKSGEIVKCQGYEPSALNILETAGYTLSDIRLRKRFKYFDPVKNKQRYYFADITIGKEKRVIEVKSEYTLSRSPELPFKKSGVEDCGYTFEVMVL